MDQNDLHLERGYDRRADPICTTYQNVHGDLLEHYGNRYIVYGRWNKLFGCWIVDKSSTPPMTKEILPDWRVIFESKDYAHASRISALKNLEWNDPRELVFGKKADHHFASYIRSIPMLFQKLAGPYGWKQWLVLDLCHQIPGFWRFLHGERHAGQTGYVGICLAMYYEKQDKSRASRRQFGDEIRHLKRSEVLESLLGRSLSKSNVRIISRLSADARGADISTMMNAFDNPDAYAAMTHVENISADFVTALDWLPAEFLHPNLSLLVNDRTSVEWLDHTVHCVIKNLTPEQVKEAAREFQKLSSIEQIEGWADRWEEKGKRNIPFPPVPFNVAPPLNPIETISQLEAEGRNMRNCVAGFYQEILDRDLYFFHWGGDEPASVAFMSTPSGEWRFEEALGYANKELRPQTLKEIMGALPL